MERYVIIRTGNDHGLERLLWALGAEHNQWLLRFLPKDPRPGGPISPLDSQDQCRHLRDRKIGSQT